jgi:hypothetical protein
LLIWNLKEGWDPLCKFLGKQVPTTPVPKVNVTGDGYLGKEVGEVFGPAMEILNKNIKMIVLKFVIAVISLLLFWFRLCA